MNLISWECNEATTEVLCRDLAWYPPPDDVNTKYDEDSYKSLE